MTLPPIPAGCRFNRLNELVNLDGRVDADLFGALGDAVDLALAGQEDQQGLGALGGELL